MENTYVEIKYRFNMKDTVGLMGILGIVPRKMNKV